MSSQGYPATAAAVVGKRSREEKQRRWEAKQEAQRNVRQKQLERETWFCENAHFATTVSQNDVEDLRSGEAKSELLSMLLPYYNLQDGGQKVQIGGDGRLFIAEGTETVRLLVQHQQSTACCSGEERELNSVYGTIDIKSIFTKPSVLFDAPVHLLEDVERAALHCQSDGKPKCGNATQKISPPPPFHVLVASEKTISSVAGFTTSRGAMACGVVPQHHTEQWLLKEFLPRRLALYHQTERPQRALRLLALDGISDTANLGTMIRCASAFGVDAVLLSTESCDPWYRRSVRTSMGHIFRVPCVRVANLATVLKQLANRASSKDDNVPVLPESLKVTSYAAVIDQAADLVLERVERGTVPSSWCCVMGNESTGISPSVVKACTHTLRIDMSAGVDSLSVPIATGILLHGLRERESKIC